MKILSLNTGFIEVPGLTTLNIYVVGCSLNCPGCHNPELQNFNHPEAYKITIQSLFDKINAYRLLIDGICWMGGEPLDQAEKLNKFIEVSLFTFPRLKHIIYTGYTLKEIEEDSTKKDVVSHAILVKTGRWEGIPIESPDSNQKFYLPEGEDCWMETTYNQIKFLPW